MTWTETEAFEATLNYFNGDDLATSVWLSKYALRDANGALLERTPEDMHHRLAAEFARIEQKYPNPLSEQEIFDYLKTWEIVPQGSPMSGIGNPYQLQSLSNCFVIDPCKDSFGSILRTDEEQCQIMKRRGGVGHDISNIRPRGAFTNNAAKSTDGISAFMERFSTSCRTTAQGGRRGALMLTIACNHYEIETFVDIKKDRTKVTGANISIRLSDEFMHAVETDGEFMLQWPVDVPVEQAKVKRQIKARELWNKIITAAHDNAEPGLLFWDNVLKYGPADIYPEFRSISTNPCSEITLSAADSCRLLLVNLDKFVNNRFTQKAVFDFKRFGKAVKAAQRLMDDLVDLEIECVEKIIAKIEADPEDESTKSVELNLWKRVRNAAVNGRRTGLGITGLGDVIAGVNMVYGSDESIKLTGEIYKMLAINAYMSSAKMAKERGAFPAYDATLENDHVFLQRILEEDGTLRDYHEHYGRRNISITTTPPAGSVSILTQTTSGIEPVFMLSYMRRKKINPNDKDARVDFTDAMGDKWMHFDVYHPGVKKWMEQNPGLSIDKSPYHGSEANNIDWHKRVELQAAAQKWVCHSISSTINLPRDVSVETVADIYMLAYKLGLKGITVYRDGARDGVLVNKAEEKHEHDVVTEVHAPKRPKELECDIHRVVVRGESYVVLVGLLDGTPYEVFAGLTSNIDLPKKCIKGKIVKNGRKENVVTYNLVVPFGDDELVVKDIVKQFDNSLHGTFTRMISLALRHGISPKFIAEQIKKDKNEDMMSFSSSLARVLSKNYIKDGTKATLDKECQECHQDTMVYENGCVICKNCGASKCS